MSKTFVHVLANTGLVITLATLFSFSIINIAVVIERLIFFRNNGRTPETELILAIREPMLARKFDQVLEIISSNIRSSAQIIRAGISHLALRGNRPVEMLPLELALDNAIARESLRIEKYIWSLGTIGAIAPLVGLFGTVLGIMRSFAEIAMRGNSGQGVVEVAAGGIWESLYTTAFGILVAVPALVAYNYFVRRSRTQIDMIENTANDMISLATELAEKERS